MSIIDLLNPLNYIDQHSYTNLWHALFAGMLQGFWARLFAWAFLGLSLWFGVRRRNIMLGFVFFIIAIAFTYGSPLFKLMGLII